VKLEGVTIGTELVLGLTPDTSAAELCRRLAEDERPEGEPETDPLVL